MNIKVKEKTIRENLDRFDIMGNLNFLTLKQTLRKIKWQMTNYRGSLFIAYNKEKRFL